MIARTDDRFGETVAGDPAGCVDTAGGVARWAVADPAEVAAGRARDAAARQGGLELGDGDAADAARRRFAEHLATCPPLRSYVGFAQVYAVARSLGLHGEMPPAYVREHIALFLAPMGGPSVHEIRPLWPGPVALHRRIVAQIRAEGGYARRSPRFVPRTPLSFDAEDLRRALPEGPLRGLLETRLDPLQDEMAPIDGTVVMRLCSLRSAFLRTVGIVDVLLHEVEYPGADLSVQTAAWERLDDAFHEACCDPRDPEDALLLLTAYAIWEYVCPNHAPGPRLAAVDRWFAARNRIDTLVAEAPELAEALEAVRLPPLPRGRAGSLFRSAFGEARRHYCADCDRNRKVDADQLSNAYALRMAVMQARSRQAMRMWRECAAAEAHMRAAVPTGRHGFSWNEQILRADGRHARGTQQVYMEAIWADELKDELASGGVQGRFTYIEDGVPAAVPPPRGEAAAGRGVVFRFVDVRGDGAAGGEEAWFVDYFRNHVLGAPAGLSTELRERRRALYVRDRLPDLHDRPGGLVGPDGLVQAGLFRRALAAGLVLVQAAAFGQAMAIGFVAGRTLALTFARVGEMLQIVWRAPGAPDYKEHFSTEEVPGRGKRPAWRAIPKGGSARVPFVIYDSATLPLLKLLLRLSVARDGLSGPPVCRPWQGLERKVGPDVFVFGFRGRMLGAGDLNYIYRYLLGGVQRLRNHDIRHASSNRSSQTGATEAEVAWRLKHAGAEAGLPARSRDRFAVAARYGRPTAEQRLASTGDQVDAWTAYERILGPRDPGRL